MERKFFDVFGKLKDEDKGGFVLQNCEIERLSTNKEKSVLKVYLKSDTIIPKRAIWKLEERIKDQYFQGTGTKVRIYESFNLPDTYSAEELYKTYKDSILEEIHKASPVLFQILDRSSFRFEGKKLTVILEDTSTCHRKDSELVAVLDKIFCERLGLDIVIDTEYVAPSEHQDNREQKEEVLQTQRRQRRRLFQQKILMTSHQMMQKSRINRLRRRYI